MCWGEQIENICPQCREKTTQEVVWFGCHNTFYDTTPSSGPYPHCSNPFITQRKTHYQCAPFAHDFESVDPNTTHPDTPPPHPGFPLPPPTITLTPVILPECTFFTTPNEVVNFHGEDSELPSYNETMENASPPSWSLTRVRSNCDIGDASELLTSVWRQQQRYSHPIYIRIQTLQSRIAPYDEAFDILDYIAEFTSSLLSTIETRISRANYLEGQIRAIYGFEGKLAIRDLETEVELEGWDQDPTTVGRKRQQVASIIKELEDLLIQYMDPRCEIDAELSQPFWWDIRLNDYIDHFEREINGESESEDMNSEPVPPASSDAVSASESINTVAQQLETFSWADVAARPPPANTNTPSTITARPPPADINRANRSPPRRRNAIHEDDAWTCTGGFEQTEE